MSAPDDGHTVAVTGASGLLGRALCAHLAQRGWEVRMLVRHPESFTRAPPGARVGVCDLPHRVDGSLLEGADSVVHCAYATRTSDLAKARRVNEHGTCRMLAESRRTGVRHFIFVSSIAAHPEAPNYYARSKHALEGLIDPSRDLVVRLGLILAREGQGIFRQMQDSMRRTRLVPLFGGGHQPLQTVHVDDVCEAIGRALERGLTGSLNVAEPEPISLEAFLRMLAQKLGLRCLFLPLPFRPVFLALRVIEALHVPFPFSTESLLGLKGLRQVPVANDLRRLDMVVRTARESLAALL